MPSEAPIDYYAIDPENETEVEALNAHFNLCFNAKRTLAKYYWKYGSPAAMHHRGFYALADGQVVGQYNLLPVKLLTPLGVVQVVQAVDFCVSPDYRHGGMGLELVARVKAEAAGTFGALCFGFPNANSMAAGRFDHQGTTGLFILEADGVTPDLPDYSEHGVVMTHFASTSEVQQDWCDFMEQRMSTVGMGIHTHRTKEFLDWRWYAPNTHPMQYIEMRQLEGDKEVHGFCAYQDTEWGLRIYELLGSELTTHFLVEELRAKTKGAKRLLHGVTLMTPYVSNLVAEGFVLHGEGVLATFPLPGGEGGVGQALRDDTNWHATWTDTDE